MEELSESDDGAWLSRVLESARAEVAKWPKWKREAMRVIEEELEAGDGEDNAQVD